MMFYVLGELWKPGLVQILFWGLINLYLPLSMAKHIYPYLMLGASLGSVLAGPIITGCTSEKAWQYWPFSTHHWGHAFILMMLLVLIIGIVSGGLYYRLYRGLKKLGYAKTLPNRDALSLKQSLYASLRSPALRCISWIVLAPRLLLQ